MSSSSKSLVTNLGALEQKYGAAGLSKIRTAVDKLVAADAARGVTTALVAIDDAATMKALGGKRVRKVGDERATKAAVDAIAASSSAIVIVGAGDVVTFQSLDNPLWTGDPEEDPDESVPSDLPYACPESASRHVRDFLRPTRIVSRIPDFIGASQPTHLLANLKTAATWRSRAASAYARGFTISARVWRSATRSCATTLFGARSPVDLSPALGPKWPTARLNRRLHFINCHGDTADPKFYGDDEVAQPIAHRTSNIRGKIIEGTVVAAECCYGAELYDPTLDDVAICQSYLAQGAYGFVGSTTIAYGPPDAPPAYADIVCREFVRAIQSGLTTGEALLVARTKLVGKATAVNATIQKTLAQFYLLGDATVRPVATPKAGKKRSAAASAKKTLTRAAETVPAPILQPSASPPSVAARAAIAEHVARRGLALGTIRTFAASPPLHAKKAAKKGAKMASAGSAAALAPRVHVAFADFAIDRSTGGGKAHTRGEGREHPPRKVLLEIEERAGVVKIRELHRKSRHP